MMNSKNDANGKYDVINAILKAREAMGPFSTVAQKTVTSNLTDLSGSNAAEAFRNNKTSYFSSYLAGESANELDDFNIKAQQACNKIISLIKSEDYVEGEITKTQIYLESLYKENKYLFKESFQKTWVKLFSAKPNTLRNFVCVASCLDYSWLEDKALVLVLGASNHQDKYVNEAALRAAEAWENPDFISILENIKKFDVDWLDDYKEQVIEFLREMQ
ncbi:TPA: hypothetical protein RRF16_004309 [Klebsiella pneumoniae]|nr:hypothetical protein [Klebsiella pneumoniae]